MSEPSGPKFAPIGPTVKHDVSALISRYGKEAVIGAVKELTRAKRGRKPEKDWPLLRPYLEQDVVDWLEGRDPIEARSHYAIANAVAAENPGHNQAATGMRILKKLSARRRWLFLADAWQRAESTHPYNVHLRTLKALAEYDETFASLLDYAQADVERYRKRLGEPSGEITMAEIKKATHNALMQYSEPPNALGRLGGIFGALKR